MIRGFMAASADGYVADSVGGVSWLDPYNEVDYGFDGFMAEIDAVIMGRKTLEQTMSFGVGWPYAGKKGFVVSSTLADTGFDDVTVWRNGPESLVREVESAGLNCWVVGGPMLQSEFIKLKLLHRLELFIVPVLLGDGVPLHRSGQTPTTMSLAAVKNYELGMVKLDYRLETVS